ncbi:MAG: ABC transporter substrate-binding protein [Pseudomonadota bacterium]
MTDQKDWEDGMALTRRALSAWGLAVGLVLTPLLATQAAADDDINVGILRLTSHSPSIIAKAKGYFADEGLNVTFVPFQAAQPMAVAIASGDIDFGMTAISAGLVSLADKGAVKVIGGALLESDDAEGQKILVSKAAHEGGITTPADLAGKRYGVTTAGSSFHYMAHKIADGEGIDRASLKMVPLHKVPVVIASLKSGQIDAWSIVPNIANALTRGPDVVEIGEVADYIPGYQVTTVFTSTDNIEERRGLVERFLAALSKGIDDYNAAMVDKTMSEEDTAAIVAMIHEYVYADQPIEKADPRIRAFAMRISPGAALNLESVEDQLAWFQSENLVPEGVTIEDLVDTSFAPIN